MAPLNPLEKLNVAILGSGNIGADLLVKILRSPFLECRLFIGKNLESKGMVKARSLGVAVSDKSIDQQKHCALCSSNII